MAKLKKALSLLLLAALLAATLSGCARPEIPSLDGAPGGGNGGPTGTEDEAPARAPDIGGEDALEHDLSGTAAEELAGEGQFFGALGWTAATAASTGPGAAAFLGISAVSFLAAAVEKHATWTNWPMARWDFAYVPPPKWKIWDAPESAAAAVGNAVANLLFTGAKMLTRVSINLLLAAFHSNVVSGLADWIGEGVRRVFSFGGGQPFMPVFLKLFLVLFLVFAAHKLIRGRVASVFMSLALAALAVGAMLWFSANAARVVRSVGDFTDGVAGLALSAVGSFTAAGQAMDESIAPLDRGLIAAANGAWASIVARPWAVAVFGTADPEKLKITGPDEVNAEREVSEYEVLESRRDDFPAESFARVRPGMRADTLYLATAPGTPERDAVVAALGAGRHDPGILAGEKAVDHGGHPGSVAGLSPGGVWGRAGVAFLALFAALAFAALAVVIGGSILVCQFMLSLFILALPLALLALLVPDAGYAVALKYGRTVLGYLAVKLIYGIYLALVLALTSAVAAAGDPAALGSPGFALLTVTAIYLGAVGYRKKFLDFFFDQARGITVNERQARRAGQSALYRAAQAAGILRDLAVIRGLRRLPRPGGAQGPAPAPPGEAPAGGAQDAGLPARVPDGVIPPRRRLLEDTGRGGERPVIDLGPGDYWVIGEERPASPAPEPALVRPDGVPLPDRKPAALLEESSAAPGEKSAALPARAPAPGVLRGAARTATAARDSSPRERDTAFVAPGSLGLEAAAAQTPADEEAARPRGIGAGTIDLGPQDYTVLAGELAPEAETGPARAPSGGARQGRERDGGPGQGGALATRVSRPRREKPGVPVGVRQIPAPSAAGERMRQDDGERLPGENDREN